MWSGKVPKTHLIFHLLVLGFAISAALLTISPLGESESLTSCFVQFAIFSRRWTGRGGTNERLALGCWTRTCHSNFQSGRRINQRLNLTPEPEWGLKLSCRYEGSSHKSEMKNGAQGHCNCQTCSVLNDNYCPKYIEVGQQRGCESKAELLKQFSRDWWDSPLIKW